MWKIVQAWTAQQKKKSWNVIQADWRPSFLQKRALQKFCFFVFFFVFLVHWVDKKQILLPSLKKEQIRNSLAPLLVRGVFPQDAYFKNSGVFSEKETFGKIQYSLNADLQKLMTRYFQLYHPDYGVFVALEPHTGRVLSLVSYSQNLEETHLAFKASFPSASIFKIITVTAAIEGNHVSAETIIPVNGRNHTLYRKQILKSDINRWTRFMTVREAFAHSINPVFGKMGAFTVGPRVLREVADRFGFNRNISGDLPVEESHAWIPEDSWGLAESASGFTRDNTMSPLQGVLIAASVVNDGVMLEPSVVDHVQDENDRSLYDATPKIASMTMSPQTARELRKLMQETVLMGTSRKSFRGFFKKRFSKVEVGGKTGSLTGLNPKGKYDWFVGYADDLQKQLAIAVLTIHKTHWTIRSADLARKAIESYFQQ